jgi:hypothetical protein
MNYGILRNRTAPGLFLTALIAFAAPCGILAQRGAPAGPPPTPRAIAPLDFTGYWVSVVTEDWAYRMVLPDKGDFTSIPLNAEGRKVGNAWDPAKDTANGDDCKAFGAGAIMRVPERLHITWDDPKTLKVETDAGKQTRIFHFGGKVPAGEAPTLQGYSIASWEGLRPGAPILTGPPGNSGGSGGAGTLPPLETGKPKAEGFLKVVTTNEKPGYLRTNGVPYSADANITEYFDSFKESNGDVWLVVTTVVTDPTYLQRPFVVSTHFKKQADDKGWNPTACLANLR